MKKLISPTEWLLLSMSGLFDFIEDIKDPLDIVKNYYKNFYGYVPDRFHRHYFYACLWRSLKTGYITKKIEGDKVILELSTLGKNKLKRKFSYIDFQNKEWDGLWRLVIFDIKEIKKKMRDLFREKLKELGFAQLQKSVWITPHNFLTDMKEFIENIDLKESTILIETEYIFVDDIKEFTAKLWQIEEINALYQDIYEKLLSVESIRKVRDREQILYSLREEIVRVYIADPFLPKELLPEDWWGEKVRELIKEKGIFTD